MHIKAGSPREFASNGFLSLFDGMKGIVALVSSLLLIAVLAHDINTELLFNPPFTQFDYRGRI